MKGINSKGHVILVLAIFSFLLSMCTKIQNVIEPDKKESFDYRKSVFYEIFVQSFADSNGDGIGDIPGMTSKLDYLVDLGIDVIWLMPMSPSPSYHKYDVTDYKGIHPDYGTMDDFKTFISEAHNRNIKVVMDFVVNHSSAQHPWFLDAIEGKDAKYRDYYVWADKDSIADQLAKKETSFDSDNIRQWHPVNEDETKEHYYGFFYGGMPDLNYDNLVLRKEIYEIGKYWLREVGLDGFRLDAAKHIFPDDRAKDSHAFWVEFKSEMQKINPNVYLIGEVWSDAEMASPYAAGFTSLFNFDRAFSVLESINKQKVITAQISGHGYKIDSNLSIPEVINTTLPYFSKHNPNFIEASFLSNHDQNRVASVLENDLDKNKLAASILFTLPGTPYIYYGEEIGMLGMKPDENIREPMIWNEDDNDNLRATWMKPEYSTAQTINSVQKQSTDDESLLNHYKALVKLKKSNVLSLGDIKNVDFDNQKLLAFTRNYQNESFLIIHNLSENDTKIDLNDSYQTENLIWKNGDYSLANDSIKIGPRSSLVFKN
ncbi:MAG: alpha-glucosidase C-terminal domain-containing protein [Reichenbachiella sp.]